MYICNRTELQLIGNIIFTLELSNFGLVSINQSLSQIKFYLTTENKDYSFFKKEILILL